MNRSSLLRAGLLGGVTSLTVMSINYLGQALAGLPFVPFDIFDWIARALPGGLITFGIDTIVMIIRQLNLGETSSAAKAIEQTMAILQLVGGGVVLGVAVEWLRSARNVPPLRAGAAGGLVLTLVTLAIEAALGQPEAGWPAAILWIGFLLVGWGLALGWMLAQLASISQPDAELMTRRGFLAWASGGSLAAALAALGLGRLLAQEEQPTAGALPPLEIEDTSGPAASPPEAELAARIEPAPGTRSEVTSNENFYRIDINTTPPRVDAASWQLDIGGLVNNPLSLTIDDILTYPSVTQVVTMQCISNPVGGDLTGTSHWTGVPFRTILEQAQVQAGAQEVYIESADGFYESVALDDALDGRTLLVYAMNGVPLPVEHGFPLRIYLPNRFGMKQPKWIVRMELIDEQGPGYWVDRGWSEEAFVLTTSVVDTVAVEHLDEATNTVPVGGIAWAGDGGISRVEVQVDSGEWVEAELRSPPLSPLSWIQWRYQWPFEEGEHVFAVRAYDGAGQLQVVEKRPSRPDGATGVHTYRLRA